MTSMACPMRFLLAALSACVALFICYKRGWSLRKSEPSVQGTDEDATSAKPLISEERSEDAGASNVSCKQRSACACDSRRILQFFAHYIKAPEWFSFVQERVGKQDTLRFILSLFTGKYLWNVVHGQA